MKKILVTIFLSVIFVTANAQLPQYQWANGFNGSGDVIVLNVVADNQQNVYTTGTFEGVADFDPGNGTANLTAGIGLTNRQAFVAKYDAQGNYIFAFQINAFISDLILDNEGDIIVGGHYDTIVDFDPGNGVVTLPDSGGQYDAFVAKYSPIGNYMSSFSINGTDREGVTKIAVDANNNLYVGGSFKGTIGVDPNSTTELVASFNDEDLFIAKYAPNGTLLFGNKLSGAYDLRTLVIAQDQSVVLAGIFNGTVDLDPGANNTAIAAIQGSDGFYSKYDSVGNYIKGFAFDGYVSYIKLDANDDMYIMGIVNDSMDLGPGPAVYMIYSVNNINDYYIAKIDANDNVVFAHTFKGTEPYIPEDIMLGPEDAFYVFGSITDSVNFTPGNPAGLLVSNTDNSDAFIAKFDLDGNYLHGVNFGDTLTDKIYDFTIDNQGNIWTSGYYRGTVDFDFSQITQNLTTTNTEQAGFIARYLDPLTSIKEEQSLPVKIYGAENKVFVDFTALAKTNAQVQVLNILGQTVYQTSHNQSNKLTINLPETGGQIYFVRIINGDKTIAKKLWVD